MQWEKLLSLKRYGDAKERKRNEQDDTRLGFEVDYDRIIFSSAFRSLQDKTQVIPFSKTDFVHTRLTHSLEVSVVGRSIGRLVGKQVLEKHPYLKDLGYQMNDFGAIVAAAALSHDIGNPPFGHSGEKAIGEYFSRGNGQQYREQLTDKEWQDLIDFEGNANGLKVLCADRPGVKGGLRLSYATLGAFMKYPKESLPKKPTKCIEDKKYGFFQADKIFFNEVVEDLGLIEKKNPEGISFKRHPLTFLVEAADDICYSIIDFEDGIKLGLVAEAEAIEILMELVKDSINKNKYDQLTTSEDRISYLRALSINTLIWDAVQVFMKNEEAILKGKYSSSLTDDSKFVNQLKDIIKISVADIYQSKGVIMKEIIGYKVIASLLDVFITAFNNKSKGEASEYDKLILKQLPDIFLLEKETVYQRLLHISHFVSLLTDGRALQLYKMINGERE
ncbi:MAG: dNTP triphosphohydrolase [Flavobacteriales bacterium]|nr:dNTP triphosphohydrolase [Flavobacteriales bacterium]